MGTVVEGNRSDPFRRLPWLVVPVLAWLAIFPLTSVDVYYHLFAGRWMLDHGTIPTRGIGSATFGEKPWHDNEWGFQLLAAALGRTTRDADGVLVLTRGGQTALIFLRVLALGWSLALLSAQMARDGIDGLTRSVALVLGAFLTFNNLFWAVRPQIFSYFGIVLLLWLLTRDRTGNDGSAWWSLLVIALWANLHGAFIIGIVLLGTEWVGELLENGPRKKRLGWVALLSPLAACLNPHGIAQLIHPFLYLTRPEIHTGNAEWTRPDYLHLPLFLLALVLLGVGIGAAGRVRWRELLRVAAFLGLFTTAIRHLPLAVLVLVPVMAGALTRAASRGGWRRRLLPTGPGGRSGLRRLLSALVLVVSVIALSGARFVGLRPEFGVRMIRANPEEGVRFLVREGVEGNGFNSYGSGGFLMFRLYPEERVFMDGRNDLYLEFRDQVYNRLRTAAPGWQNLWRRVVREYDIGWVLLDRKDPLVDRLLEDPGWISRPGGGVLVTDRNPGREVALLLKNTERNMAALERLVSREAKK